MPREDEGICDGGREKPRRGGTARGGGRWTERDERLRNEMRLAIGLSIRSRSDLSLLGGGPPSSPA